MPSIRRCHNEKCKYNLYGSICDGADICIDSDGCCEDYFPPIQPQTNAERIRAMSDEELAVFLADEISHGDCYGCVLDCATYECDKFEDFCYNAHYRWLKQPAEVDNG